MRRILPGWHGGMTTLAFGAWFILSLPACGVGYTIMNSESKLDRLVPSMPKEQIVTRIGKPDMVLRDDGRVTVWQYNMSTSRQWLYELSLCPVSVWVGGCIFYPFTNLVFDYHREHPVHLIMINDQLCVWGPPLALLQKRKGCVEAGLNAGRDDAPNAQSREIYPVTMGYGPINSQTIDQYQTMAVMTFADAPGAPGSGARVSGIVTTLLLDLDVTIVERGRLEQVFEEQVTQLKYSDEADALHVGKIAGARAIVVGEVQQWELRDSDQAGDVAVSLRIIDVETGQVLFDGEGHSNEPLTGAPDNLARLIVHRILSRFGTKSGLIGTGRIGVKWEWRELSGSRAYVVTDIVTGSPADKAGLKPGDVVVSCNQTPIASTHTERQAKRACQVEAGQLLPLEVMRGDRYLAIQPTAEKRPGI